MGNKVKLSYSVIKEIMEFVDAQHTPKKELVREFLQDRPALRAYVNTTKWVMKYLDKDHPKYNYDIKKISELEALIKTIKIKRPRKKS